MLRYAVRVDCIDLAYTEKFLNLSVTDPFEVIIDSEPLLLMTKERSNALLNVFKAQMADKGRPLRGFEFWVLALDLKVNKSLRVK